MPQTTTPNPSTTQPNQFLLFLKHTGWLLLAGVPATLFLIFGQYVMLYWIPVIVSILIVASTYIWYFWCIGQSYLIYTNPKLLPKIISTLLSIISLFLLIALSFSYMLGGYNIRRYELYKKCDGFEILSSRTYGYVSVDPYYFIYKDNSIRKIQEIFDKSKKVYPNEIKCDYSFMVSDLPTILNGYPTTNKIPFNSK